MRILTIILGVLAFGSGISCMLTPGATFLSLAWIASIVLIVSGISNIIYYFMNRKTEEAGIWFLLNGILSTILGFLISGNLFMYVLTDMFIIYAFATWLILVGILQIAFALKLKKNKESWVLLFAVALLTFAMGIYSFFHPAFAAISVGMLMGFWLMTQGINLIGLGLSVKK